MKDRATQEMADKAIDNLMLELAAKAIGRELGCDIIGEYFLISQGGKQTYREDWNPLVSDGDAFRLAVKLNLLVMPYPDDTAVRVVNFETNDNQIVSWGTPPDPYAATRRAIVRAAAAIGRAMP